jgi:lambda repressor-like predicted transcriptional regulator
MKKHVNKKYQDMPPVEIWIAMQRSGVGQKEIADKIGVSRQHVHMVITRGDVSHKVRQAISEAIGIDLKILWPSTYLYNDGPRKAGRPSAQ